MRLGIIFNGATGELAARQHLPALMAIRDEGGLPLANGQRVIPDVVLVGRDPAKLAATAARTGFARTTARSRPGARLSLDETILFDAAPSGQRLSAARRGIAAGKHLYLEKPVAGSVADALSLHRAATAAGIKAGTVQDKLFLPGFSAILELRRSRLLRPGPGGPRRDGPLDLRRLRPSRANAPVGTTASRMAAASSSICFRTGATWSTPWPARSARSRRPAAATCRAGSMSVERPTTSMSKTACSRRSPSRAAPWPRSTAVGAPGPAASSPSRSRSTAPRARPSPARSPAGARPKRRAEPSRPPCPRPACSTAGPPFPSIPAATNAYRAGWELFLRHVAEDAPFPYTLLAGAKGVQLAECAYRSDQERRWIDVPPLKADQNSTP